VVGTESLVELQENVDAVNTEKDLLLAENNILKDKVNVLTSELELTKRELMHKEELLALYKIIQNLKTE